MPWYRRDSPGTVSTRFVVTAVPWSGPNLPSYLSKNVAKWKSPRKRPLPDTGSVKHCKLQDSSRDDRLSYELQQLARETFTFAEMKLEARFLAQSVDLVVTVTDECVGSAQLDVGSGGVSVNRSVVVTSNLSVPVYVRQVNVPLPENLRYVSNREHLARNAEDVEPAKVSTQKYQPKVKLAEYRPIWVKKDLNVTHGEAKFPWKALCHEPTDLSPVSLFESVFTHALMEFICRKSNEYASQKGQQNFDLNVPTLKLFIAILLLSRYVPLPRHPMYWEASGDVHNLMVSGAMSRNRFSAIISNLHFASNNSLDASDKFAKVRPLLDHVNSACLTNFHPEQVLSVDESMVPYFGHYGAEQYIHGTPIKFGYKMWVLATRLGYCVQFFPYRGAVTTDKDLGLGGSVVTMLTKDLPKLDGNCYYVVFDNRLLRTLASKGIAATGTLRPNRTEGACLRGVDVLKKEPHGSFDVALDRNSDVCLVRRHDSKVVTVASAYVGAKPLQKAKR